MGGKFTDFFETVLPREIVLYVMPGTVGLLAWLAHLYLCGKPTDYLVLGSANSARSFFLQMQWHHLVFIGIVWMTSAYIVGLILGFFSEAVACAWKRIGPNKEERKAKQEKERGKKEAVRLNSMYVALREQPMYAREIERNGVLGRATGRFATALLLWVILMVHHRFFWAAFVLFLLALFVAHFGGTAFKTLQLARVEALHEALTEVDKQQGAARPADRETPSVLQE